MLPDRFNTVVKTFQGLEEVLASEVRKLPVEDIEVLNRAVRFRGNLQTLYMANYRLRTALKVLAEIHQFNAKNDFEFFQGMSGVDWLRYLDPSQSIAVESVLSSDHFTHSHYISLRVKDAIVDQLRDKTGKRVRVDRENPDVKISIYISDNQVGVFLDSSGAPLYKRGYRANQVQAPVNEVLAAGLLLLAGFDGSGALVDPMCGSGTFLIEGAMIALNIDPGVYRNSFGFENWKNFDADLFTDVIEMGEEKSELSFPVIGSDASSKVLLVARDSLRRASLDKKVELHQKKVEEFIPPPVTGWVVTNPPYGERIRVNHIEGFYKMLGDRFKNYYKGYQAWVFSGNPDAMKAIGLHPAKRIALLNGSIPCTFRRFDLYSGSKKQKYQRKPGVR